MEFHPCINEADLNRPVPSALLSLVSGAPVVCSIMGTTAAR
jgi:hypothetical protein